MDTTAILGLLKTNPDIGHVPEDQLRWLIDRSECRSHATGEMLFGRGDPTLHMFVILSGKIRLWFEQGGEKREMARLQPGDISGVLPYSRLRQAVGFASTLEPSTFLALHRDHFPEMIRTQYELTEALVHTMTNRVRNFTAQQQQNEKLLALGKLSAGLAHELNNPAAAVVRSAQLLKKHLAYLPEDFKRVIAIRLEPAQVDAVNEAMFRHLQAPPASLGLMERTDREDEVRDWLEDNDIAAADEMAEVFVEAGFTTADLNFVLEQVSHRELAPVLGWMRNVLVTERFVSEIEESSRRISDLVQSVKAYTHMDQAQDRQPVDVHAGIRSTARMLQHKFRKNGVTLVEAFGDDVQPFAGYPGEINQVWTNLMDNALDAMEQGGTLEVKTYMDGPCVFVSFTDSGKGIPPEVLPRIFDPFYTTKPMGKGTGLGLDVVQRIVQRHRADIEVDSRPGQTVFRLYFPTD
ncbi:MAG: ATP-binding protein [Bacteroidia bacterium]